MPLRFLIALGVWALLNCFVAARLMARIPWAQQHTGLWWGCAAGFMALQLAGPFGDRLLLPLLRDYPLGQEIFSWVDWASYLALGILSCLFIYCVFVDIAALVWIWIEKPADSIDLDRRAIVTLSALTLGTAVLGVAQAQHGPVVREVDIPLGNLPAQLDGFRIVQISDLHVSSMIGRDYVQNVVGIANGLKPDLIALTGDFADGTVETLAADMAPLAQLSAPHGTFFITGNHEYYWGADEWIAHFRHLGAQVLLNQHQVIERDGSAFILAGVTDYSTLHSADADKMNPQQALAGAPQGLVKILLAHQPASYEMAHAAGFDLQLSGHTHAGQYFPFNLFIGLFQRYYKGLNRHKDMWVYVNRGSGFWGPPLRTANPSEITLIKLRRATA